MAGRPRGAENKDKPFREALRMELAKAGKNKKALREVARALISKASGGDVQAIREVADRLDGKPSQAIEGGDPNKPLNVNVNWILKPLGEDD